MSITNEQIWEELQSIQRRLDAIAPPTPKLLPVSQCWQELGYKNEACLTYAIRNGKLPTGSWSKSGHRYVVNVAKVLESREMVRKRSR